MNIFCEITSHFLRW